MLGHSRMLFMQINFMPSLTLHCSVIVKSTLSSAIPSKYNKFFVVTPRIVLVFYHNYTATVDKGKK